ncbi:MAG: NAD-dependent protein deacylase [Chlorobi bacterium]|nr:NAD-dependent protein deacylase [Chlorobiota bacterium]
MKEVARLVRKARYGVVFTGAGISVASGLRPFRGENGLWNDVNPNFFEIGFFHKKPYQSWKIIKDVFYDKIKEVKPNIAHEVLAAMAERGFVESVITQNIDGLHQMAGSKFVYELHGSCRQLVCTECMSEYDLGFADLNFLPPTCYVCKGILKPDMVFFNEPIPHFAKKRSFEEAEKADLFIIIGANAEVYPANSIPLAAKEHGAKIIEINIIESHFTHEITDVFLQGKASEIMAGIGKLLYV